jgi:REP element-mobilizing transposase RayT
MTSGEAFLAMDRLLDMGRYGPVHLRRSEIAAVVRDSIQYCAGTDYDLHAWVIMPNHVHLLATPHTHVSSFLRRLKGFSSRAANRLIGHTGQRFWQDESYDRLVRTQKEFNNIERYILVNPVRAGLVSCIEDYPWSSGYRGN